MHWFYLAVAGVLETGWAVGLKLSQGFTRPIYSVATVLGMTASFYYLSLALKGLPLGTSYAVWTGIGTVGTLLAGALLFREPVGGLRLACVVLILSGIAGLKWLSPH